MVLLVLGKVAVLRGIFVLVTSALAIALLALALLRPLIILDHIHLSKYYLPDMTCKNCNEFKADFIVENVNVCKNELGESEDITLLILVASYHPNVQARRVIRQTWGSVKEYKGHRIKTLFIFGVHKDKNLMSQITYELEQYGDVIQYNVDDRYRTLTNKTMLGLNWVLKNCPKAKYVLKTDDDAFNIPQRFVDYVTTIEREDFIGGYCFSIKPDRSPGSKFYTTRDEYPDYFYPTYCSGPGYLLSNAAVKSIVNVAQHVKFLHMEDVFVTGVCRNAANIPFTQIAGIVVSQHQFDTCSVTSGWVKNTHNVIPEHAQHLWNDVVLKADPTSCRWLSVKHYFFMIFCVIVWLKIFHKFFK